mmetsp:Transcript_24589/g.66880  ORF Transcript_24589/g.66880 Transcript_24589/m.66880 type:complete len:495 (+) Transcript_24589:183-1667(+)
MHDHDFVALTKLVFEMDVAPEAPQLAVCHDTDAVTQRICLIHRVSREDDNAARLVLTACGEPKGRVHARALGLVDELPHEALGLRVKAGGGLVEEDDRGAAHEGDAERDAALLASRERVHVRVELVPEVHRHGHVFGHLLDEMARHTAHSGVEEHVVAHGELGPQRVELGAHADAHLHLVHGRAQVVARDEGGARGGRVEAGEHGDGRRLAGTVGAQEPKALAFVDVKSEVVDAHLASREDLAKAEHLHGARVALQTTLQEDALSSHIGVLHLGHVLSIERGGRVHGFRIVRVHAPGACTESGHAPPDGHEAKEGVLRGAQLARQHRVEVDGDRVEPEGVEDHEEEGEAEVLVAVEELVEVEALGGEDVDAVKEGKRRNEVVAEPPRTVHVLALRLPPEPDAEAARYDDEGVHGEDRGLGTPEEDGRGEGDGHLELRPDLAHEQKRRRRSAEEAEARHHAEHPEQEHHRVAQARRERPLHGPVGGDAQAHHLHE